MDEDEFFCTACDDCGWLEDDEHVVACPECSAAFTLSDFDEAHPE